MSALVAVTSLESLLTLASSMACYTREPPALGAEVRPLDSVLVAEEEGGKAASVKFNTHKKRAARTRTCLRHESHADHDLRPARG